MLYKTTFPTLVMAAALFLISGCTKENNTEVLKPKAVVEGYLLAGKAIEVKIKEESITGTIDSLTPITNLDVYVVNSGVTYKLNHTANGLYRNTALMATAGQTYRLKFDYNGKTVSAETEIPQQPTNFTASATTVTAPVPPTSGGIPGTPPKAITFKWANPTNAYHLMVVTCIETNPVKVNTNGAIFSGNGAFRTEPTQGSVQDIPPMQFKYYGVHEVVLYRILPEYAALYEDTGSNSNNLTAPPTNVTNGLGIFTGVNIATKLYLTVN